MTARKNSNAGAHDCWLLYNMVLQQGPCIRIFSCYHDKSPIRASCTRGLDGTHTHTLKQTESQKNMFLEINFLGNWMKIADGRHVARYIHAWFHLQNSCVHELDHTNTYLSTDTHIQHSLSWSKQYLRIHIVWLLMWCAWCGNGVWSMMPTVWGMNTVSWGTMSSLAFTLCQVTLHVKREIKIMKMEMHQTTIKIRKRARYNYLTPSDKSQIM